MYTLQLDTSCVVQHNDRCYMHKKFELWLGASLFLSIDPYIIKLWLFVSCTNQFLAVFNINIKTGLLCICRLTVYCDYCEFNRS